jgi:dTMP kinase
MTVRGGQRGLLVALEGIDGSGKSSLQRRLISRLRKRGLRVMGRHEPNDSYLGRYAQQASLRDAWTGAVFFTLDRYRARPNLLRDMRRSDVVVTDRSLYSTVAYQGSMLSPRARSRLMEMQSDATVLPDRVILLDLPPSEARPRLRKRHALAPLERRQTQERVRRTYRKLARHQGWLVLDARQSPLLLSEAAERYVLAALSNRPARRRRRS